METTVGITVILAITVFLVAQYRENKKSNREFGAMTEKIEGHTEKIQKNSADINALGTRVTNHTTVCANERMGNAKVFAEIKGNLKTLVDQGDRLSVTIDKNDRSNRKEQGKIYEKINELSGRAIKVRAELENLKDKD